MDFVRICDRVRVTVERLRVGEGLRAKAIRGGAWLGSGSVAEQFSRFPRNMLLARILAPSAFGTMAIVLSFSSLVESLTEVGVRQAIIQNPRGGENAYLNTGWWMGMVRGIGVYAIIFAVAPWVPASMGTQNCPPCSEWRYSALY
jgi:O-antigen/teichoic acid export membrane protein